MKKANVAFFPLQNCSKITVIPNRWSSYKMFEHPYVCVYTKDDFKRSNNWLYHVLHLISKDLLLTMQWRGKRYSYNYKFDRQSTHYDDFHNDQIDFTLRFDLIVLNLKCKGYMQKCVILSMFLAHHNEKYFYSTGSLINMIKCNYCLMVVVGYIQR